MIYLILYVIGVIICLVVGIIALKQDGGKVKDLFGIITLSTFSWVTIISFLLAYLTDKIRYSDFWNKDIFK